MGQPGQKPDPADSQGVTSQSGTQDGSTRNTSTNGPMVPGGTVGPFSFHEVWCIRFGFGDVTLCMEATWQLFRIMEWCMARALSRLPRLSNGWKLELPSGEFLSSLRLITR